MSFCLFGYFGQSSSTSILVRTQDLGVKPPQRNLLLHHSDTTVPRKCGTYTRRRLWSDPPIGLVQEGNENLPYFPMLDRKGKTTFYEPEDCHVPTSLTVTSSVERYLHPEQSKASPSLECIGIASIVRLRYALCINDSSWFCTPNPPSKIRQHLALEQR
jgi:hypothetical protein